MSHLWLRIGSRTPCKSSDIGEPAGENTESKYTGGVNLRGSVGYFVDPKVSDVHLSVQGVGWTLGPSQPRVSCLSLLNT